MEKNKFFRKIVAIFVIGLLLGAMVPSGVAAAHADPTIDISSLSNGDTVFGSVTLRVDAWDYQNNTLDKIEYYIDGSIVHIDNDPLPASPASTYLWNTTNESNGQHTLKVVGYDFDWHSSSDEITVTVNNTAIKMLIIEDRIEDPDDATREINFSSIPKRVSYVSIDILSSEELNGGIDEGNIDLDNYDFLAVTTNSLHNDLNSKAEEEVRDFFKTNPGLICDNGNTGVEIEGYKFNFDSSRQKLDEIYLLDPSHRRYCTVVRYIDWEHINLNRCIKNLGVITVKEISGEANMVVISKVVSEGKPGNVVIALVGKLSGEPCYLSLSACASMGVACPFAVKICSVKAITLVAQLFEGSVPIKEVKNCDVGYTIPLEDRVLYHQSITVGTGYVWNEEDKSYHLCANKDEPTVCPGYDFPIQPYETPFLIEYNRLRGEGILEPPIGKYTITFTEDVEYTADLDKIFLNLEDNSLEINKVEKIGKETKTERYTFIEKSGSELILNDRGLYGTDYVQIVEDNVYNVDFRIDNEGNLSISYDKSWSDFIDEIIEWYNENKDEIMIFFHEIVEAFFDFVDELISEYKKEK